MLCLKAMQWPALTQLDRTTLQTSILDLKIFLAICLCKLLCYWPTIHNSISTICPKFQVISFHFFKVNELLGEHWAKIQDDCAKWKYFNSNLCWFIVECDKMYWSYVCIQEFWYFVSGLDTQLEQLEKDSLVRKNIGSMQVAKYNESSSPILISSCHWY